MPSILGTTSKRLQPHSNSTRSTLRRRRNHGGSNSQSVGKERGRQEYEMNDPSFKKMFIYICVIVAGFLWNFYTKNK